MLRTLFLVCLIFVTAEATTQAQIQISLDRDGNTNVDLGAPGPNKVLDFYVSKPAGGSDNAISAASPTYAFDALMVADPPGRIAPVGASADSGSGFFGDGNLLTSDPLRRDSATGVGANQEFQNPEALTETPQLWFSLDVDTSGVQDGNYAITLTNPSDAFFFFDGGTVFNFLTPNNDLSFTVNSVVNVVLGDVDMSGTVNFLDISPFITVLSGGTFQAEADCDESGAVDFLDISPFIGILSGT